MAGVLSLGEKGFLLQTWFGVAWRLPSQKTRLNMKLNSDDSASNRPSFQPVRRWTRVVGGTVILLLSLMFVFKGSCADSVRLRMVPELTMTGTPGGTNIVQYVDLLKSDSNWIPLTNIVMTSTSQVFYDASAPATQKRFYRVISQGPIDTNVPAGTPEGMVWIPAGNFTMGSLDSDPDRQDNEMPAFSVVQSFGFWMGKYEVTQKLFSSVVGSNPSFFQSDETLPVDNVTWYDATNYCYLLNQSEKSAGRLPTGYAYRLPTEAEWEYASRAGSANRFEFGSDLTYSIVGQYGWTLENSDNATHPVGLKKANTYGVYDMHGNVYEWCSDWFGTYVAGDKINPTGPIGGVDKVYRGGSWGDAASMSRCAARGGLDPSARLNSFGFRVVLAPVTP